MKYCFDLKIQAMYGIVTFLVVLAFLYLFTRELNWIASVITGLVNFAISGYYTNSKCK